jgi:hypothetical protein
MSMQMGNGGSDKLAVAQEWKCGSYGSKQLIGGGSGDKST